MRLVSSLLLFVLLSTPCLAQIPPGVDCAKTPTACGVRPTPALTDDELDAAAQLCAGDAGKTYPKQCADVARRAQERATQK